MADWNGMKYSSLNMLQHSLYFVCIYIFLLICIVVYLFCCIVIRHFVESHRTTTAATTTTSSSSSTLFSFVNNRVHKTKIIKITTTAIEKNIKMKQLDPTYN